MIITAHKVDDADASAHNDDSDLHKDEVGENTGEDTGLATAIREEKMKVGGEDKETPKKED